MANYEEAEVKLTNTQLSKPKSAEKSNTGTTLMIESGLLSIRIFLSKLTLKIGRKKNFWCSVLKIKPWRYKIKEKQ